ncbi:hypothetical protein CMI37_20850 [Candidatus Pacearchaeota archaeon]|nr:hypothetical protein [Candidatus Pacearchaeota archaeon]|tara:strand:+ start:10835 stop:11335 length:501 start_codon:yes stop_codon:yes gene_type:complete
MSENQYDANGRLIPPKSKYDDRSIGISGKWKAVLTRGSQVIQTEEGYNVITTSGLHALADYLCSAAASATQNPFFYIAIGSDNTAETNTDTALGTELSRHTGTVTAFTAVYQVVATFASGSGTGNIYEYGLFNANTGGKMLSRDTEGLITKGSNDILTVTAQITLS